MSELRTRITGGDTVFTDTRKRRQPATLKLKSSARCGVQTGWASSARWRSRREGAEDILVWVQC
tara:strand:- start:347 stop:538 length:192 start_codon:yes stop_codon:yes gene_type:complete